MNAEKPVPWIAPLYRSTGLVPLITGGETTFTATEPEPPLTVRLLLPLTIMGTLPGAGTIFSTPEPL